MILTIALPDEVYSAYAEREKGGVNSALGKQLERFKDFSPQERVLIMPPAVRRELEGLFQGPIEDPAAFARWVRNLLSMDVGGVEVTLTPAQLKLIADEAKFFKKDPAAYAGERVRKAISDGLGGIQ